MTIVQHKYGAFNTLEDASGHQDPIVVKFVLDCSGSMGATDRGEEGTRVERALRGAPLIIIIVLLVNNDDADKHTRVVQS